MFLLDFPDDILLSIWDFFSFDPKTLCLTSLVCKKFLSLSNLNHKWKEISKRHFAEKVTKLQPGLHPFFVATKERLKDFHVDELMVLIKNRDNVGLLNEGHKILLRSHLEKSDLIEIIIETNFKEESPIFLLNWSCSWKLNYAILASDSMRSFMTVKELTDLEWDFSFVRRLRAPQQFLFWAKFNLNYTFVSNIFDADDGQTMPWRFVDDGDIEGDEMIDYPKLNSENFWDEDLLWLREEIFGHDMPEKPLAPGENFQMYKSQKIQIANYPPLVILRNPKTWQWILTNMFVIFKAK